jgi:hypothetical protein
MSKNNPKNHSFDCIIIQIALCIKLQSSAGFRAIEKIIAIFILYLGLSIKEPSYGSILLWTKKMGIFQLERRKKQAEEWVIILDESIEFGHEKLLVIYGISCSSIKFRRALNYQEICPLAISSSEKWTGEQITKEIERIEKEHGKIAYAVADGGNAIKKALKICELPHVYDITHKLAWFLKEIYKEDRDFQSYAKAMAKMRGALSLSNVSHVLPPNQRTKSRFMNLDILSDWGQKVLDYLDREEIEQRAYTELTWVKQYRELIDELAQINQVLAQIKTLLKTEGLSVISAKETKKILFKMEIRNERVKRLQDFIADFLDEQLSLVPQKKTILCSSDIIESAFGKYKSYINNNPMVGITDLSLVIAAFTSDLNAEMIKKAMEEVKVSDIKSWNKINIGQTNFQKRQQVLKKVG